MFDLADLKAGGKGDLRRGRRSSRLAFLPCLVVALGLVFRVAPARAQQAGDQLVIFLDCSAAMNNTVPHDARTYYQAAVQSATDEIKFALEGGTPVRVIPFRERALERPDSIVFTPGKAPLNEQLNTAKFYFDQYAPKPSASGAAIWDTLLDVMPKIMVQGRRTAVSIYTANQDNRSSNTQAQARTKLREQYKDPGPTIEVLNPADGLPPRAGVKVSGPLPILDAAACARGATALVQVEALVSSAAGVGNVITVDRVDVAPLAGAPALKVEASLPAPLGGNNPGGTATLTATGVYPAGANRYEYDLQFYFRFRARPADKANPDEILSPGRPLRLVVASTIKPEAQFTVSDAGLRLRPGEYKDVAVTINYNAAASAKVCQVRSLAPKFVTAEFYAPGAPAPGPGDKGEPEINVALPVVSAGGNGGSCTLVMRLRAEKPTRGQVQVTGRVGDASPVAPPMGVDVEAPVVRVALGGKGEQRTVLAEGTGRDQWQDLGHPLTIHPDAPLKGATATLTLVGGDTDVAVAFDRNGAATRTVALDGSDIARTGSTTVDLYARLNSLTPASPPSMPAVRVEVSDKNVVIDPPSRTIPLDGAAGLSAPDFWIVSAEGEEPARGASSANGAGAAAAGAGSTTAPAAPPAPARTLALPARKVRVAQEDAREILIQWNAAAMGTVIDVAPESSEGGKVLSVEPVSPGAGPAALTALGPWRLQVGKGLKEADGKPVADPPMSGRVRVHFVSGGSIPASKIVQQILKFTPVPGSTAGGSGAATAIAAPPAPWIVQAAYNVAPTVFTVIVDKGGQELIPLYVGASQPVANVRAWSDGLPGKLLVKFQPHTPGDAVGMTLGEQAAPEVPVAPEGQQATAERGVSLSARFKDFSKAGRKISGDLVLQAVTDDPTTVIEVRESAAGAATAADRVPFEFEVKACSLHALWNGKDTKVIPGDRFMVTGKDAVFRTSALRQPVQFKLLGADTLPDEIATKKVRAVMTNPDGLIQSVKFEVNGKEPQDEVALGDVMADQVRGLVITASPDKGERIMRKGEITLEVPDLAMSVPLDVNMRLPDQGHYLLWVGLGGAAVVGLLVLLAFVKGRRQEPATVAVASHYGHDGEESLLGGPAPAYVPPAAPAPAPARAAESPAVTEESPPEEQAGQGESLWS